MSRSCCYINQLCLFSFPYQAALIVDVWDDDPEFNGDDLIDKFTIPILDMVSALNESESKTLNGEKGNGQLTIAYYNFTTDQLLVLAAQHMHVATQQPLLQQVRVVYWHHMYDL